MPDLVVVVPGIMGSVLSAVGRDVWNTAPGVAARALPRLSERLAGLALPEGVGDEEPDGPDRLTPSGLILGWHLWPGFWAGMGYGPLVEDFLRRARKSGEVRFFPYDWRLSNRRTARLLGEFVERELHRWRAETGDARARAVIVAHSMGGLVARYYLEVLGGRQPVRRLVTVGTPYSGSIKAVQLLTGHTPWYLGPWQEPLTHAARSMPSLWQLLPTYRAVATGSDPVQLMEVTLPGLETEALRSRVADGVRFHAEIAEAAKGHGAADGEDGYTHHVVVGDAQPTLQSIALVGGRMIEYRRAHRGRDFLGDGTVARFSAVPSEWKDDANAWTVACRHGALLNHRQVRRQVWNVAHALDLGAILAPQVELGLDVPEVAGAQEPLPVQVRANRGHLRIVTRLRDPNTEAVVAERTLQTDGDGGYFGELPMRAGIWQIEVSAVGEQPPAVIRELIVGVERPTG